MSRRIAKEIKEEILSKVQAGERVADLAASSQWRSRNICAGIQHTQM